MIFLTTLPLWLSAIIVVITTMAALAGPVINRHRVELARLRSNNEIADL